VYICRFTHPMALEPHLNWFMHEPLLTTIRVIHKYKNKFHRFPLVSHNSWAYSAFTHPFSKSLSKTTFFGYVFLSLFRIPIAFNTLLNYLIFAYLHSAFFLRCKLALRKLHRGSDSNKQPKNNIRNHGLRV
jgi:hypothetical protein